MVSSATYPGLERKPGGPDNWVERAGGLPNYIERIAKHLHYEKGMSISRAIAVAVNTVKRWAAGGTVTEHGTTKRITPKTQAQAAAAVAEWQAKRKAGSLNLSDTELWILDLAAPADEYPWQLIDLALDGKCAICNSPATKKVIWADGRAYQPSCDAHVKQVQNMLTKKNGAMTELSGVQDLSDADISDTDTMVALMLDPDVAKKIAVEGGIAPGDMHVTVTFHGETTDEQYQKLCEDLKAWAADMPNDASLKGQIGGIGTFPSANPEKGTPWFAPVDVPGLNTLHEQVKAVADRSVPAKSDHGYSPHTTLTYAKDGEGPPSPVPATPVKFSALHVVRGGTQREEIPLTKQTSVELSVRGTLPPMAIDELAKRANAVADPKARAKARQSVLDLASSIAPRGGSKGRASDGRRSYKRQGKWGHGFVPLDQAAKESKAKGSPIAIKRLARIFKGRTASDSTGRAGGRSGLGRKKDPKDIRVNEKSSPVAEGASDIGFLRNSQTAESKNQPESALPKRQLEASKGTRVPARARQNWDEIPENLKTVRNGKRYVYAEFAGKGYVTEWLGGVSQVTSTALDKRKLVRSLSSATINKMTNAQVSEMINNSQTPASVKTQLRRVQKDRLKNKVTK